MKKTISVIVAIAMMLMVSIPAFAGNFDDNADLTAQQKVFAEVIFDGLNAGNNTADTLANYVGSNLDYKADVTSPATITDDVSEAFDAANEKLTVPFTDEALINSMKLRTSATITGRYQAANGEGSSNIGPGGSGSNVLDKLFPDFSNGDFIYEMIGLPQEIYTPIFAMARIVGWTAHRIEELNFEGRRIIRPAYKNILGELDYTPLGER